MAVGGVRLREVRSVVDYGRWATGQGFNVAEGPDPFGPISPTAHTATSLHYDLRAVDINVYDNTWRSGTESDGLRWLYHRTLDYLRAHPRWPLDEMFHADLGFVKELGPGVNHAITAHEGHLHVGFKYRHW